MYAVLTDIIHKNITKVFSPFPTPLQLSLNTILVRFGSPRVTMPRLCTENLEGIQTTAVNLPPHIVSLMGLAHIR